MTHTPENVTEEQRAEVLKLIRLAVSDPATFVERIKFNHDDSYESLPAWSARAVMAALDSHPLLEIRPYHPTTWAYDQACKALESHRQRVEQLRDRWEAAVRDPTAYPPGAAVHAAALAASHLPELRRALDGEVPK